MNQTINIYCVNTEKWHVYPSGITLQEVLEHQISETPNQYLGALVNNKCQGLSYPLFFSRRVEFIDISSASGHRIYAKSLAFVLHKAVKELYPHNKLRIEHAIGNGFYCHLDDTSISYATMTVALRQQMQMIISKDLSFDFHYESSDKVLQMYLEQDMCDKVELIKHKGELFTSFYTLDGTPATFYSNLVPSTSYLKDFDLQSFHDGMVLSLPLRKHPNTLPTVQDQPKLMEVFKEFASWNRTLHISNIANLNTICATSEVNNLMMLAEALQEKKVIKISEMIAQKGNVKMILISGPSSSGKTTFSKRLALQLKLAGLTPVNLSLDDYYVNRELSPLDENGEYDYEHLETLNLDLLNEQLQALLDGKAVHLPKYDFKQGKSTRDEQTTQLQANEVLVVEGIHALNPKLTALIDDKVKFKVYISALTTISIDDHNYIPTSDNRLMRRIVRDYNYRGTNALESINRWESVRRGEDRWIYPYQEEADVMFNSSLLYELPVLKPFIEPILKEVKPNTSAYVEAQRLLKLLSYFRIIDQRTIPPTSLLREFLGGSSFNY